LQAWKTSNNQSRKVELHLQWCAVCVVWEIGLLKFEACPQFIGAGRSMNHSETCGQAVRAPEDEFAEQADGFALCADGGVPLGAVLALAHPVAEYVGPDFVLCGGRHGFS
jgi:hypothetical protein